jgi:choline kinase
MNGVEFTAPRDAILLVAGMGSRLRPLTDDRPKCLLEVGGEPLLVRLLRQLGGLGVERVVLATGYLSAVLEAVLQPYDGLPQLIVAPNRAYETTNNAESLRVAMNHLEGRSFLLCDGDVLLRDDRALALLARDPRANVLTMIARDDLGEEEMKIVADSETGQIHGLSKKLDPQQCHGESLGLQKVGGPTLAILAARLEAMSEAERASAYYEDIFAALIEQGHRFYALPVAAEGWTEIDTVEDLEAARRMYETWQV